MQSVDKWLKFLRFRRAFTAKIPEIPIDMNREMKRWLLMLLAVGLFPSCSSLNPWASKEKPNDISQQLIDSDRRLKQGRSRLEGTDVEEQTNYERIKIREHEAVRNWWRAYKGQPTF